MHSSVYKVIPKLAEGLLISLSGLIPQEIVQLILDSTKNVLNYNLAELYLTEPIKIQKLFTNVSKIQNIE